MMEAAVVVLEQLPSSLMMRDCSNRHHCRRRKPEHFLKPLNPTLWKWENCSPTSIENSSTAESPPISTTVCNISLVSTSFLKEWLELSFRLGKDAGPDFQLDFQHWHWQASHSSKPANDHSDIYTMDSHDDHSFNHIVVFDRQPFNGCKNLRFGTNSQRLKYTSCLNIHLFFLAQGGKR